MSVCVWLNVLHCMYMHCMYMHCMYMHCMYMHCMYMHCMYMHCMYMYLYVLSYCESMELGMSKVCSVSLQTELAAAVVKELRQDQCVRTLSVPDLPKQDHAPVSLPKDESEDPFTSLFVFYACKALEFPEPMLTSNTPQPFSKDLHIHVHVLPLSLIHSLCDSCPPPSPSHSLCDSCPPPSLSHLFSL